MKAGARPLLVVFAVASTRCFAPPARSSGPSATDGIEVAIVGQYCEESSDPDWVDNEAVQLRMKVGVTNKSSASVEFHPDRMRLVAPDRVSPGPVGADPVFVVRPGETKVATVRFMNRGSLKCKEEMQLDLSDGLVSGARRVPLRPISFVAQNGS